MPSQPEANSSPILHRDSTLASLGAAIYEDNSDGELVHLAQAPEPAARLLSSESFLQWARSASQASWGVEPTPGLWSVEVTDHHRDLKRRVALLLSPDFLDGPAFANTCAQAGVGVTAGRSAMREFARFNERSAEISARMLRALAGREELIHEHKSAAEAATDELGRTYETIHLLYGIGRSMADPSRPGDFLRVVCDRLAASTDFGWVAAICPSSDNELKPEPTVIVSGTTAPAPEFMRRVQGLLTRFVEKPERRAIVAGEGLCVGSNSQCLVQPASMGGKCLGLLLAGDKGGNDRELSSYDMQLFEAASKFVAAFLQASRLFEEQVRTFVGTLRAMTAAIDAKDPYTRGHSDRVAWFSRALALQVGFTEQEAQRIHVAGLVHDVGKIGVPEAVLCKPGRLTEEEFAHIRRHPEIGHGILVGIPQMSDVLPGVLHHHERYDGKGYPHGLAGEAIPLQARIIAVADTFDAMSSTRSYRSARPRDVVLAEIARSAGTQLDPGLAAAAITMDLSEYDALLHLHAAASEQPVNVAA
ncbi:MAG: HD-GYP domain-containing protein [Planctomycetota bacterium]